MFKIKFTCVIPSPIIIIYHYIRVSYGIIRYGMRDYDGKVFQFCIINAIFLHFTAISYIVSPYLINLTIVQFSNSHKTHQIQRSNIKRNITNGSFSFWQQRDTPRTILKRIPNKKTAVWPSCSEWTNYWS